jgi:hypothetical protein
VLEQRIRADASWHGQGGLELGHFARMWPAVAGICAHLRSDAVGGDIVEAVRRREGEMLRKRLYDGPIVKLSQSLSPASPGRGHAQPWSSRWACRAPRTAVQPRTAARHSPHAHPSVTPWAAEPGSLTTGGSVARNGAA